MCEYHETNRTANIAEPVDLALSGIDGYQNPPLHALTTRTTDSTIYPPRSDVLGHSL